MIEVIIDHSYEDNFFQIDTIEVKLDDKEEKERVEELTKRLEGALIDPDCLLSQRIAATLKVDVSLNIDRNEVNLM